MTFSERGITPAAGLKTEDFLLRPIVAADAELDYEAVMESREFLRLWSQSSWPEDDFTVAANREDMVEMETRHNNNYAYGYTVMNLEQTECLGCVYIFSTDAKMYVGARVAAIDKTREWSDHHETVHFWVRKSRLAEGLDRALLDALVAWFDDDWSFQNPLFVTSEGLEQQVEMIEGTDLLRRFRIEAPADSGPSLAYASA
ncbi:MAG: GNAT family N-acetyltransferase [Acidimicrobiales bacterium]